MHVTIIRQGRSADPKDALEKCSWPLSKKNLWDLVLVYIFYFHSKFYVPGTQITFISWPYTNHTVSHFSIDGHPNFPLPFSPLPTWILQESPPIGSPPITHHSPQMSVPFQSNLCFLQSRHSTHCITITCSLVCTRLGASGRKDPGSINGNGKSGSVTKYGEH